MTKIIKVLYTTRYTRKGSHPVPRIQLEGNWLEELGFSIGDAVSVDYENGEIRIRALDDKAQAQPELSLVAESKPAFRKK